MNRWLLALLGLLLCCATATAREWSDSTGVHKTEANLVAVRAGKAYLEKTDGKVIQVPFDKLHVSDLRYLLSLAEHRDYFRANPIPAYMLAPSASEQVPLPPPEVVDYKVDSPDVVGVIRKFPNLKGSPDLVAFSPNGKFLAVSTGYYGIVILDVDSGRGYSAETKQGMKALAFSLDSSKLVGGDSQGSVWVWGVSAEGALTQLGNFSSVHDRYHTVSAIGISGTGTHVLSGDNRGNARYWDLVSGHTIFKFDNVGRDIRAIHITPRGKQAVVTHSAGLSLLDLENGSVLQTTERLSGSYGGGVLSHDASKTTISRLSWVFVYDVQSGQRLAGFDLKDRTYNAPLALSPDGSYLVVGRKHGIDLVEVASSRKLYEFNNDSNSSPSALFVSADGRHVAVANGAGSKSKVEVIRLPAEYAK